MKKLSTTFTILVASSVMAFNFTQTGNTLDSQQMIKDLNTPQQRVSQEYLHRLNVNKTLPKVLEKEAIYVLNKFIEILQTDTFQASAHRVIPLMHKSLLTQDGENMDQDTLSFSFKKAYTNAKNYAYPVKITRIDRLKTTEIGHGNSHEVGIEFKFWIAKKNSNGYSAPLVLFFKQHGSNEPKLSYVGSI